MSKRRRGSSLSNVQPQQVDKFKDESMELPVFCKVATVVLPVVSDRSWTAACLKSCLLLPTFAFSEYLVCFFRCAVLENICVCGFS